jgi:hypothetical protein
VAGRGGNGAAVRLSSAAFRVAGGGPVHDLDPAFGNPDPPGRGQPDQLRPHQTEVDPAPGQELPVPRPDRQQEQVLAQGGERAAGLRRVHDADLNPRPAASSFMAPVAVVIMGLLLP